MRRLGFATAVLLLLAMGACTDTALEPALPNVDGREALIERLLELSDIQHPTAANHAEAERLVADILEWNRSHPDQAIEMTQDGVTSGDGLIASAVPIFPGLGCKPCPWIIRKGNLIGILRSEGPCRRGAGLERCFYTWYNIGVTASAL